MITFFLVLLAFALGISWVLIYLKGYWYLKAGFITLLLYLSLSVFLSVENLKGWATSQALPEDFKIEAIFVREPDKVNKKPGAIYVWVSDIESVPICISGIICINDPDVNGPRAFILNYSSESHEKALGVMKMLEQGVEVRGEKKDGDPGDNEMSIDDIVIHEFKEKPKQLRKDY